MHLNRQNSSEHIEDLRHKNTKADKTPVNMHWPYGTIKTQLQVKIDFP